MAKFQRNFDKKKKIQRNLMDNSKSKREGEKGVVMLCQYLQNIISKKNWALLADNGLMYPFLVSLP